MTITPRRPATATIAAAALLVSTAVLGNPLPPEQRNPSNGVTSPGFIYGRKNCNPRVNSEIRTRKNCFDCCAAAMEEGILSPGQWQDCLWYCCGVAGGLFPGGEGPIEGDQPGSEDDNA